MFDGTFDVATFKDGSFGLFENNAIKRKNEIPERKILYTKAIEEWKILFEKNIFSFFICVIYLRFYLNFIIFLLKVY